MSIKQPLAEADELISLIYQGPLEPKPWLSFLHCLRLRMDCDTAGIGIKSNKGDPGSLQICDTRTGMTNDEARRAIKEHARMLGFDPLANALSRSGYIYILDDVIPRSELPYNEYYNEILKRYGVEYELCMRFSEPSGWKCQLNLNNGPHTHNFGAEHKEFLAGLCPHLGRSLALYARIKSNESKKGIIEETLERLGVGTLILDGSGRLIDANSIARRIAAGSSCLSLLNDRVVLRKSGHQADFDRLLKKALAHPKGGQRPFVEVLRLESSEGSNLDLLIRSVATPDPYQSDVGPSVVVYVADSAQRQLPPERFIAQLFGLTSAEAFLASLLAIGFTLTESAEKLDVTESTIRTYAKRVFAKTGVSRQADLVRVILKSVAALA